MDIKNYFIEKLGLFDENYMIALGNKGLYKRAQKELDKNPKIKYELKDDKIEFEIEGNTVEIGEENRCSCISRTTCKHIISAYLYLKKNSEEILGIKEEAQKEVKVNFDYILEFDYEKINKNKLNLYKKALKKIELNFPYSINEGSILEIEFDSFKIRFFPEKEIIDAKCSCNSKELCNHKLEAVACYRHSKGLKDKIEKTVRFSDADLSGFKEGLKFVREEIENILNIGLVRYKDIHLLEQLKIKLRSCNMPIFERKLNYLIRELNKFINKNSNFNIEGLKKEIINLLRDCVNLDKLIEKKDYLEIDTLIGKFRSEYEELPVIQLHSLGYEKWNSSNGKMETVYFTSKKGIYTFSSYVERGYSNELNWKGDLSFNTLKIGSIELKNAKSSEDNKLSSSKETIAKIIRKVNLREILEKYSFNSWKEVLDKLIEKEDRNQIFLLKIKEFLEGEFDGINQNKVLKIVDKDDKILTAKINYRLQDENYIRKIETIEKSNQSYSYMLGKIFLSKGEVIVYPLILYKDDETVMLRS